MSKNIKLNLDSVTCVYNPMRLLPFVIAAAAATTTSTSSRKTTLVEHGKMCKIPNNTDSIFCLSMKIPSTVLTTLVANAQFSNSMAEPPLDASHPPPTTLDTIYYKDNLAHIPEIFESEPEFYTFYHFPKIPPLPTSSYNTHRLVFRGLNYDAEIFHGETLLATSVGMWRRTVVDITPFVSEGSLDQIHLLIKPVHNYGIPTSMCDPDPSPDDDPPCGQGGDHSMAQDAGAMQFLAGWDWAQGVPDRATGIYDRVYVESTNSENVRLSDPRATWNAGTGTVDLEVKLSQALGVGQKIKFVLSESEDDGGRVAGEGYAGGDGDGSDNVILKDMKIERPQLWWPHTLGASYLYDCTVFLVDKEQELDEISFRVGLRTITPYIHPKTKGRSFLVNGVDFFIQGGNWIATDSMLQMGAKERYQDEVNLHKHAGLNLIRVWGGGLTERPEFYEACDEAGMMVMQGEMRGGGVFCSSASLCSLHEPTFQPTQRASHLLRSTLRSLLA